MRLQNIFWPEPPFCDVVTLMPNDVEAELREAVDRVLRSASRRKLVVAGPGAGKTTLFRKLLEGNPGDPERRLVLTFINNLKTDLERSLGDLAQVFTLHGFCQSLLRRHENLRNGLTRDFRCLPGLASIIKQDWEWLRRSESPHFVELMRHLQGSDEEIGWYFDRANYYDAVDFDDSVYRTYQQLRKNPAPIAPYELVLIDEYQDFNQMEAGVIELLALSSPIVVAGDDDQALYSQLRAASWDHIRALYAGGQYEVFHLPFCMRCPEVIVDAVNDVIQRARAIRKLHGRIDKPYRHYEPVKGADSRRYPTIGLVTTTVQRLQANYFGKYLEQYIRAIPQEHFDAAAEKHEPAVLIIGNRQYLRQIHQHLTDAGFVVDAPGDQQSGLEREQGFEILSEYPDATLGWRIILAFEGSGFAAQCVRGANDNNAPLMSALPAEKRAAILNEANEWAAQHAQAEQPADAGQAGSVPNIKMTSYEGAKGLSAQHVFIVGLHAGDLPRDAANVQDIEICRFVVALTRTKKKCSLMLTRRFANEWKHPSLFLSWIRAQRFDAINVDARFWH